MRILLDTHVWLWMLAEPHRLAKVEGYLLDTDNELYLSAASTWEIGIKYKLGRLDLPHAPRDFVPPRLDTTGVRPLPISLQDTFEVAQLPQHHRDPFDRLLISQAKSRGLVVMTADSQFDAYEVELLKTH